MPAPGIQWHEASIQAYPLAVPVGGTAMVTVLDEGEPVIRTPDQRLRVFVSSTLGELAEERAAARAPPSKRCTSCR